MNTPKTPEYIRRAVKAYEKNLIRKSLTFDVRKDDDMELLKMIEQDGRTFTQIARTALLEHLRK